MSQSCSCCRAGTSPAKGGAGGAPTAPTPTASRGEEVRKPRGAVEVLPPSQVPGLYTAWHGTGWHGTAQDGTAWHRMARHASPALEMPRARVPHCLQCPTAFPFPFGSDRWGNKGEKEAAATSGEQNITGSCQNRTETVTSQKGLGRGHGPSLGLGWGFYTSGLESASSSPRKCGCRSKGGSWEWEGERWPSRGDGSCREFTGNTKTNSKKKKKKSQLSACKDTKCLGFFLF